MTDISAIEASLGPFRQGLVEDGYDLHVERFVDGGVSLRITAGAQACSDCLVPKDLMLRLLRDNLRNLPEVQRIELAYPSE